MRIHKFTSSRTFLALLIAAAFAAAASRHSSSNKSQRHHQNAEGLLAERDDQTGSTIAQTDGNNADDLSLQQVEEDLDFHCDRLPPALWCSCEKVQAKCGFDKFCAAYEKASRGQKIRVTLLYESLCPDCQQYITRQLIQVNKNFKDFVELELVPFGNADLSENGTIVCQHGEEECQGNRYESCAIHFMSEPIPFIACLEGLLAKDIPLEKASRKCYASIHTVPHIYDQINHCYNGQLGNQLQAEAAQRTAAVWPDQHEFVPWILINNASLENAQTLLLGDLQTILCQLIVVADGVQLPAVCQNTLITSPSPAMRQQKTSFSPTSAHSTTATRRNQRNPSYRNYQNNRSYTSASDSASASSDETRGREQGEAAMVEQHQQRRRQRNDKVLVEVVRGASVSGSNQMENDEQADEEVRDSLTAM